MGQVRRARFGIAFALSIAALAAAAFWFRGAERRPPARPALSVTELLGARRDSSGYARADTPRAFQFPADHGPHREFQTEWWYWTGVLDGPGGRMFGYQLTFFRFSLSPEKAPPRPSGWAATDVYMAHFTLTDERGRTFRAFEKMSREALGLAGASGSPFHVWVLDWDAAGPTHSDTIVPIHLRAAKHDVGIDLALDQGKPLVMQGDHGLSRKGREPGNASYYYSFTRMPTRGSVTVDGTHVEVHGESWMDREFSTSALEPGVVGWDWLGLALSGDRELMFYRLRHADGSTDAMSAGSLVDPDGSARQLGAGDVTMTELATWRSPRTGTRYPSSLRLTIPSANIDLLVAPVLNDQELDLSFRYWEGAVRVQGREGSAVSSGRGYLELTGYGEGAAPGP
jgi:predicted secreted hydrolase